MKYKPDTSETHQEYELRAERPLDSGCNDRAKISIHSRSDIDKVIKCLHELGFSVKLFRTTDTTLVDETFSDD